MNYLALYLLFFWGLFHVVLATQPLLTNPITDAVIPTNGAPLGINLSKCFKADPVADTNMVWVSTSLGGFAMELYPSFAPQTVANFLAYVNDGAYENTLIHRSASYQDGTPFVIQTGGYTADPSLSPIATFPPIPSEFSLRNIRGSVAMALVGSDSNSATSQWFINLSDNTANLDLTNAVGNPPFTVFANVLGTGMSNVVDRISALPLYILNGNFNELPLQGVPPGQTSLQLSNLVSITRIATLPYFAVSQNSSAYTASVNGTNLRVAYTGGTNPPSVPVWITAVATDTNGLTTNSSFRVWHRTNAPQTISFPYTNIGYSTNQFFLPELPSTSDGDSVSNLTILSPGPLVQDASRRLFLNGTGTITFRAVSPPNLFYQSATNVFSIVIGKGQQNIIFPQIPSQTFNTNPLPIPSPFKTSAGIPVQVNISSNSPVKSIGGKFYMSGTGTATLIATQTGTNPLYFTAAPVTNTFRINPATQFITFPSIANKALPAAPFGLGAKASSGLPVSYSLISNSPAILTNGSTLRISSPGTITVVANQSGNNIYLSATPITNSFRAASNQSISAFKPISNRNYATNLPIIAISPLPAAKSGLPVFISVKSGPATLGSNNTLTITGAGTVTLSATQSGNSNYFPAPEINTSFVVGKASQIILPFTGVPSVLSNGIPPFTLNIPSSSSGLSGTYLRVTGAGSLSTSNTISLTNAGTLTITATNPGNSNYLAASLTINIRVLKGSQSITFPGSNAECEVGKTYILNASSSSGLPITYNLVPKNTPYVSVSGSNLSINSLTTNRIFIVASQRGNPGYYQAVPVTNSFTIIANQGGDSSGGSISLGGGNPNPTPPQVVTNGPAF